MVRAPAISASWTDDDACGCFIRADLVKMDPRRVLEAISERARSLTLIQGYFLAGRDHPSPLTRAEKKRV
jgi:hypothetical protein